MNNWNENVMGILDKIRRNSYAMSEKHRKRFLEFSSMSKYFDLPVIVCSVFSSSFSGLNSVPVEKSTMITTSISMFIAVLTSIKLYLNLSSNINEEIGLSKDFYILSIDIFKVTQLNQDDRHIDPLEFVNGCYSRYIKLIEASSLLRKNIKNDELVNIDIKRYLSGSPSSSVTSDDSSNDSYPGNNPIIKISSEVWIYWIGWSAGYHEMDATTYVYVMEISVPLLSEFFCWNLVESGEVGCNYHIIGFVFIL